VVQFLKAVLVCTTFVKTAAHVALSAALTTTAQAQESKLALGMSGWTGFAQLTLADKAGLFKKHGMEVEIKMIPHKDRHMALTKDPKNLLMDVQLGAH
jgi:NitT/TauT family transport system substrate-binding protein